MFIFGHLGVGSKLVRPLSKGLPIVAVLCGTILPDCIDKVLYYGLRLITGRQGAEFEIFRGTRTIGHTGIFLVLLTLVAFAKKSRVFAALALGVASHLVLDAIGDGLIGTGHEHHTLQCMIWPLSGLAFPVLPHATINEHLGTFMEPYILWGEIVGFSILIWDYWKRKNKPAILETLQENERRDPKLGSRAKFREQR